MDACSSQSFELTFLNYLRMRRSLRHFIYSDMFPCNVRQRGWCCDGSVDRRGARRSAVIPTQTGGVNHPELAFLPPTHSRIIGDITNAEGVADIDCRARTSLGPCRATVCVGLLEIAETDDGVGNEQVPATSQELKFKSIRLLGKAARCYKTQILVLRRGWARRPSPRP